VCGFHIANGRPPKRESSRNSVHLDPAICHRTTSIKTNLGAIWMQNPTQNSPI
jgi:hypothetical protein